MSVCLQVCEKLEHGTWIWDEQQKVSFVKYDNNQLVGYDDQESLAIKVAMFQNNTFVRQIIIFKLQTLEMTNEQERSC